MKDTSVSALLQKGAFQCSCGKMHQSSLKECVIGQGVLSQIVGLLQKYHIQKPFVLADTNTMSAAGNALVGYLQAAKVPYILYVMPGETRIEPDESAIGSIMLHWDNTCDGLITVGSGVLNDLGKIVASLGKLCYFVVGTAPSMDGYASGTSSVIRNHLKVSVNSKCPNVVIGDTDILAKAPIHMIRSGIGDMLAKYISLAEWKIGHIITGEYYCPEVAQMIETALQTCVDATKDNLATSQVAGAVMEGMVLSGIAADYAGISRPVSGIEHYFSHVWDMRYVAFHTPSDFHGIQCGIGTVAALKIYRMLSQMTPDENKALSYTHDFDYKGWCTVLQKYLGPGAETMLDNEKKEKKYDLNAHRERLQTIISHWQEIKDVMTSLPTPEEMETILRRIGAPTKASEIGLTSEEERFAFLATKDVRNKYIASRLLWDLGELDCVADTLFPATL